MNANTESKSKVISNAKQHLRSFGNDVIDRVENSHSDFNIMLKKISSEKKLMNRFSELAEKRSSVLKAEDAAKKAKVTKAMNDIKCYLSQLRAGAATPTEQPEEPKVSEESAKNFQELFKIKMDSLAKTLSSVAPDVTEASSVVQSSCEANLCSIMEFADDLMNPTLDESGYASPSPLEHSWFTVDDDSDSVSKLSVPYLDSEYSRRSLETYEEDPGLSLTDTTGTRTTVLSHAV